MFEEKVKQVPAPASLVIVAVTDVAVLYENPEGAVITIVPLPVDIARAVVSVTVGPASVVHVAVPFVVFVSALMALPPVAAVTVTAAKTLCAPAKNKKTAMTMKKILFLFIGFIYFTNATEYPTPLIVPNSIKNIYCTRYAGGWATSIVAVPSGFIRNENPNGSSGTC